MAIQKTLTERFADRLTRTYRAVQRLLVKKADDLHLTLLTINMMVVLREREQIAIANILPRKNAPATPFVDFALLYLDLPIQNFAAGFYKLQTSDDTTTAGAALVNLDNQVVGFANYYGVDPFAAILGVKNVPAEKLPIFDTFTKSNDTYVIGGVRADGEPFTITLSL